LQLKSQATGNREEIVLADPSKYPSLEQTDSQYMKSLGAWRKHNQGGMDLIERMAKPQNKKRRNKRSIFRKILDYLKFRR
jgi:hypothetical protein